MDRFEYLATFTVTMDEKYPDGKNRKIEDYLETFAALPPLLEAPTKSDTKSYDYLKEGVVLYRSGSSKVAAMLFTNSLRRALPYSLCSALAYGFRSQALYRLKAYADCLSDIDRALDLLSCPDELRLELTSLKESAHVNLNAESNSTNRNTEQIDELKYAHGENSKLPGISYGIDITRNDQDGRKLVAKMACKPGAVLAVQNPYFLVVKLEQRPEYCHHCLKKTLCLLPCDQCMYEVYCSEKCRDKAYDNYHRIECRIQSTLINTHPLSNEELLCQLRCLNFLTEQGTSLDKLYAELKEIEENSGPANLGAMEEKYYGNPRKAFLSLSLDKTVEQSLEKMNNYLNLFEAAYIVTLLRNYTDFFKKNSDILLVAKILVKLNATCALNLFAITHHNNTEVKGLCTYPLASLANHACVSNTITYIDGDGRMVLRALQNIKPGDEILCSYGAYFHFEEAITRSGRILKCKRRCKQCDKVFSYPPEKPLYVKMDRKLRTILQKNPYNIEGLWKLLNIVRGKHQRYTLQALIVKSILVDAYQGEYDHATGATLLQILGIL